MNPFLQLRKISITHHNGEHYKFKLLEVYVLCFYGFYGISSKSFIYNNCFAEVHRQMLQKCLWLSLPPPPPSSPLIPCWLLLPQFTQMNTFCDTAQGICLRLQELLGRAPRASRKVADSTVKLKRSAHLLSPAGWDEGGNFCL